MGFQKKGKISEFLVTVHFGTRLGSSSLSLSESLSLVDDHQITHLICVRLKHVLYDFWGGVWASFQLFSYTKGQKTPQKVS